MGAGLCGKGQAYRFAQRAACTQMVLPGGLYLAFMLVKQKALLTSWEVAVAAAAAYPGLSRLQVRSWPGLTACVLFHSTSSWPVRPAWDKLSFPAALLLILCSGPATSPSITSAPCVCPTSQEE